MFREFFSCRASGSRANSAVAWVGLLLVIAHAFVHGYVKWRLNRWYGGFYNTLQISGMLAANSSTTSSEWAAGRASVTHELLEFCKIAVIAVSVMPLTKMIRSLWCLEWRVQLSRFYLEKWDPNSPAIEGAAQRLQEDAYKFSKGVEVCLTVGLDVVISLIVFVPVLVELGGRVKCPHNIEGFRAFGDAWLAAIAVAAATCGFAITFVVGRRLVGLEVQNQKVEASFRTQLVILETSPGRVCDARHAVEDPEDVPRVVLSPPAHRFAGLFAALTKNYRALFVNFFAVNVWLTVFDQTMIVLPYIVAAPRLFDDDVETRILLGTLVQVSNSFDKVFTAMNTISESWAAINDFRAVLVRLKQFENNLYFGKPHPSRQRGSGGCFPHRATPAEIVDVELVEGEDAWASTATNATATRTRA